MPSTNLNYVHNDSGASNFTYYKPGEGYLNFDFSEGFKYWSLIYNKENSAYTKLSQIASYNEDTNSVIFDKSVNFTSSGMISQGFKINQYIKADDTLYSAVDVKNTPENSEFSVSLNAYDMSNDITIKSADNFAQNSSSTWQSIYSSGTHISTARDGKIADMTFYFTITKSYGGAGGEVSNLRILRADRGGLENAPKVTLNGILLEDQVYGDANYDNKFDIADLVRTKKYLAGKAKGMFLAAVDFNNDDVVAADDISLMIDMLLDPNGSLMISDSYENVSYSSLALGSVQAKSWLKNQLVLQAENIVPDFELMSPDCKATGDDRSGWLGGTGESLERGPYYIRGLISTAYVLQDKELMQKAQKWIDWVLESQNESGAFGPYANDIDKFDYWSVMPLLIALEDYYDATGDKNVIRFLEKYFAWQTEIISTKKLSSWSSWRGCDNILAVYWLYEKTGDENLIKLRKTLYAQSYKGDTSFNTRALFDTLHIVKVHDGIKMMPVMYAVTGNEYYLEAYYNGIENLYMQSGRQDGMSNGDEHTKGIGAEHGTETCAVAERILSEKIALYTFADAAIADTLENIAYNSLPQQLLPDGKVYAYFTMQNQIDASLGSKGFSSEYGNCVCYGIPSGYPCCAHNFMMAWPQFISSMWMKTSDNGLAVGVYGPNSVTTELESSGNITILQEINYPYEDTVKLTVKPDKPLSCPIYLRIPEWSNNASLKVNGKIQNVTLTPGEYIKLSKRWERADVIELTFPMEFKIAVTYNNSISIKYGAVLFAAQIEENWKKITYTNYYNREWDYRDGKYSNYNITAASDWNLALSDFNFKNIASNFTITRNAISDDMQYLQADAPIILTASGVKVNDWTANSNNAAEDVPISPVSSDRLGETLQITLIPYAFTRLRVALIPWTGTDGVTFVVDENNANETSVKFSNVTVPYEEKSGSTESDTYSLYVNYSSNEDWSAAVYINKQYYCDIKFSSDAEFAEIVGLTSDYCEHHNIVEFRRSDGTVPANFNASITVIKK